MLSRLIALVLAGVAAFAASAAPASAACRPTDSVLEAANRHVFVFSTHETDGNRELYACPRPGGRRVALVTADFGSAYPRPSISLRGHLVAFAYSVENEPGGFTYLLDVVDIRRPRAAPLLRLSTPGHAGAVVLGGPTRVAFIACPGGDSIDARPRCRTGEPGGNTLTVHKHDGAGRTVERLDTGADISLRSLRLRDGVVRWRRGDRTRRYRFR